MTKQNEALLDEIRYLKDQISYLNRKLFGKSKETQKHIEPDPNQLCLFEDMYTKKQEQNYIEEGLILLHILYYSTLTKDRN